MGISAFYFLLFVIGLVFIVDYFHIRKKPTIVTAHVINLKSSADRFTRFSENANAAKLKITRWNAIDGLSIKESDCCRLGVSKYIYKYAKEHKQPGLIGCYLSHRSLLNHLRKVSCGANDAHIIFEDDAYIPSDFWNKWDTMVRDLPHDWDIVQLGVTFPNLQNVHGSIHIGNGCKGNVGGFAYAVRHSSLSKICKHIEYMYDPLDVMIRNQWRNWRIYILWPQVCPHNDRGISTIVSK